MTQYFLKLYDETEVVLFGSDYNMQQLILYRSKFLIVPIRVQQMLEILVHFLIQLFQ